MENKTQKYVLEFRNIDDNIKDTKKITIETTPEDIVWLEQQILTPDENWQLWGHVYHA